MPGPVVLTVSFAEQEVIELTWTDESQHTEQGAWVVNEVITKPGQMATEQMLYWTNELRSTVDEFLGAWRNYLRDAKVRR